MKYNKSVWGLRMKPPVPSLRPTCTLTVEPGPIREMGEGRGGTRRIIPEFGGTVCGGPSGKSLDLVADRQLLYNDGAGFPDTRYAVESDRGALIGIVNLGFRHGPADMMRARRSSQPSTRCGRRPVWTPATCAMPGSTEPYSSVPAAEAPMAWRSTFTP